MNLDNYTPKGELEGFPKEVIAKMLEEQVKQGNPKNIEVFESCCHSEKKDGGFDWGQTEGGYNFWMLTIVNRYFHKFFAKYPKSSSAESKYPKNMWVWDFAEENGNIDTVYGEVVIDGDKCYITKQSKDRGGIWYWKYAKDIEEVQPPIPKTLEERIEAIEKHLNLNK